MNKTAIQKFAIWARTELIEQVAQRAYQYGIEAKGYGDASADSIGGRLLTAEEKAQRRELIQQIDAKGYEQVMEEVAYTWFNRFIALRFMEVNNYLPSHIRVFSDANGAFKPEILSDVLHLELPGLDTGKVAEYIENNDTEGLYRYLLLTQCNALNESLPRMFERMGGYTEMLLPNNILKPDSVLGRMVADIPEEDWQDAVQIIGWMYQYYNTELKDDTFARLKKNVKITKERIPAATQLFTPDWIVRYMVENSLGRLWVEGHPNDALKSGWKYYLDEAKQEPEVEAQLAKLRAEYAAIKPEEIKVIDPCMGSGHILVYAFDVLMQIYTSAGWSEREAAQSILKNNLYGLDIDDRAAQLAYFAVMMKARQYDRRLLTRGIQPNVYAIHESNHIPSMAIEYFHQGDARLKIDIERFVVAMHDAKEYGSILNVAPVDFARLYIRFEEIRDEIHMLQPVVMDELLPMVQCAELLAQKYDVVVTNPPYMGASGMSAKLSEFVKKNYPDSKSDLFAVFIERCGKMAKPNGYQAMITQHAWMFLSSFEKLRAKLLNVDIVGMVHLGARAFEEIGGEVVQTTSFVLQKCHIVDFKGTYCRLIEPTSQQGKEDMFLAGENRYAADQSNFSKIPGKLIGYHLSPTILHIFSNEMQLESTGSARQGLGTSDNAQFLRFWSEVNWHNIGFGLTSCVDTMKRNEKWFPYIKGGSYRRWYPNKDYVVNYANDGKDIKSAVLKKYPYLKTPDFVVKNTSTYFNQGITWSDVATGKFSARWVDTGYIYADAGPMFFAKQKPFILLSYFNTCVFQMFCNLICQGIHYSTGQIPTIPYISTDDLSNNSITQLTHDNIQLSKSDWDSYETSWDFKKNPLI